VAAKLSAELKKWRGVKGRGRKARGKFSQVEAAMRLGVPLQTYQQWEHGRHEPQGLALEMVRARIRREKSST
jgi:DNA-binding transcriptional regulator YiaG